jgi:phosphoglycerol transferase
MKLSRQSLFWLAQPAVIALALWLSLAGPDRTFSVPINTRFTALQSLAQAKATIDHGWWWTNPSLSAPSALDAVVLPRGGAVDHLIIRIVGLAMTDVASVVNLAWLIMLMVGGASAAWCFRRAGVSSAGAWVFGVLFALCPFAIYYNIEEPGLTPYLVPFAAAVSLALATNTWLAWPRRDRRIGLAGCVLLGLNGLDFAFFGVLLTAIGAVAGGLWARNAGRLIHGALVPAAIVLAAAVSLLPTVLAQQWEGYSVNQSHQIRETENAGLKVRQLVSPLPDHWLPFFRAWSAREGYARFPYESENQYSRLGMIASAGFAGLLAVLLIPAIAGRAASGDTVRAASRLTMAAVLAATVGGAGTIVSLFVSPRVYAYSRISPFLVFFSLAAVACWLDRVAGGRRHGRLIWAGVLALGLLDQLVAIGPLNKDVAASRIEYRGLRGFVESLERQLPQGAMVFQLPVRAYPGDSRLFRMAPFEHFRPYLVSRRLRWSYPALTAAQVSDEARRSSVEPAALPARLAQDGFAAVVIDRLGYEDSGDGIVAAIQAATGRSGVLAQSERHIALDLRR